MITVVFVLCCLTASFGNGNTLDNRKFPPHFMFGAATSAYQIEGAWNVDGKGENIWDRMSHSPLTLIVNNQTADTTCDSYNKYKEDVRILKELGVNHYRFSLSWSRILPTGYTNVINEAGVQYYRNVITELKANNITPLVTMYHWDLPQPLQDIGGWPNPLLVDIFVDYARVVFSLFGDEVKDWLTFNELKQICQEGYGIGAKAPGIKSPGIGEYRCGHIIIKAHAKAYRLYNRLFKEKQGGRVGIAIDTDWYEPATSSIKDKEASDRSLFFRWGWYVHPLVYGDYPEIMKRRVEMRSKLEGFSESRLPRFTKEEQLYIHGAYDFFGLNQYSSFLVRDMEEPEIGTPSWEKDMGTYLSRHPSWKSTASEWLYVTPFSIRKAAKWIKENYKNPELIITENGFSDSDGKLDDIDRINYIQEYLSSILQAIHDDKVNIVGYTIWSLMDNFEWYSGYNERFGLYHVDFNSPNKTRTPKRSADFYKYVIESRCVVKRNECL